jgi:hypothetical protein
MSKKGSGKETRGLEDEPGGNEATIKSLACGDSLFVMFERCSTEAPRTYVRGICPLQALERLSP